MGEVYRARDPRLKRDVAIKVLPEALSADPDRLRRFEQEARAAAALNHPHILSVFDIGSHDGAPYIVSELLDGETLHERLARGPLVIDAAVTLALEIADALDAAHARGLIHRDIKPSNLFLTTRGAKLLDFGVAKPVGPTPSHSGESDPTRPVEAPLTEPGITIGTVAYMSPEQVRGEPLDARSDLFSVGLVLYEMTTGQRAFPAGKSADLAAAILKDTPVPPRRLRPELPGSLEHIILKALEKNREFRYHSAAELRTDLRRLQRDSDAESALASATAGVVATPGGRRRLALVTSMAAAIVAAALLYVTRDRDRPPTTSGGDVSPALDRMQVTRLTTSGTAERPAVSPDGKYVVYVQRDREGDSLWIRQTATSSNVQIVAPRAGVRLYGSTVTPDGTFVDVVRRQAGQQPQLWRVPFLGGQGKPVIDGVWSPIGWSPDGQRLAFVRAASERGASYLMVADRDGANVRTLVTVTRPAVLVSMSLGIESAARPAWSPDGQSIAVATYQTDATRLLLAGPTTGATRFVELSRTVPFWGVEWSSGDTLIVSSPEDTVTPSQLWYVSVADGRVSRATNDINNYQGVGMTADRNSLVTSRSETRTGIWIGDGSARQGIEAVRSQVGASFSVSVAWAGDHLLYASTAEGRSTIMSVGPGGGEQQEVVANGNQPAATSNGATIVYNSSGAHVQDSSLFNARLSMDGLLPGIWRVDAGSGPAVKLARGMAAYLQITKDDRSVMYISAENGLQSPWIMSLDGGTPRQVANVWAGNFDISPDGRRLAIGSRDERARSTVLICELPACADPRPWPMGDRIRPGRLLRWTPDGRGLAYISSAGSNVWVQPLDGRRATQLTGFTDGAVIGDFAWSRDGKRLAVSRSTTTNDIVLFTGLKR